MTTQEYKQIMMENKINRALWESLRIEIEELIEQDKNITDVSINIQVKEIEGTKNFLKLNLTNR